MKATATDVRTAVLGSLLLMLPVAMLEAANSTLTRQNVPSVIELFGLLSLLALAFLAVLIPIVRNVQMGSVTNPLKLLLAVAVLVVVASIWGSIVADQDDLLPRRSKPRLNTAARKGNGRRSLRIAGRFAESTRAAVAPPLLRRVYPP